MSEPITNKDVAFAREVVALARKHGVARVHLSFGTVFENHRPFVNHLVEWKEGRNGASNFIEFELEATHRFMEVERMHPKEPK